MADRPSFRIVEPSPWNKAESYTPEAIERIRARLNGKPRHYRPSWRSELAADWREFWSDVADAPAHHALFGIFVVLAWTAALVAPIWLGLLS